MTPQELKNSILQLAIQGKLVEQRAEEGTGAELLGKILAAKNAECAKGRGNKLTRSRGVRGGCEEAGISNLPKAAKSQPSNTLSALSASPREEIPDDEKPFDIPESWEWVRLGEVGSLTRGSGIKRTETRESGYPCIRYGELYTTYKIRFSITKSFVDEPLYGNSKKISNGDIVMTLTGENKTDIATAVVYEGQDEIAMGGDMTCWSHHGMESLYLVYLMNSPYAISCKRKLATGDIIVHISNEKLSSIWLPLPPLAEQKRIVAKIEELMPLVDRYEKAWSKLKDFNKRFPADMQKSLLQMAIQGKLVEQRAEEGSARELLEEILAAKNAEGAKGKGEKSHAKSAKSAKVGSCVSREEIPDDEKPFDIPESWEWYRIGDLFNIVNGFTPLKSNLEFWSNGDIPWFTIEDVRRQGRFIYSTEKFITQKALTKNTERVVPPDTVLLCCTASVGEYAYTKIPLTTNQQFNAFVVKKDYQNYIYPLYVFEYVKTLKNNLIDRAGKTTFNFVSVGKLSKMLIPLPPLAEQKRIVAKLEELLPLCERLK